MAAKRYRVVGRLAVHFPDGTTIVKGDLIPSGVEVPAWMVASGWVEVVK